MRKLARVQLGLVAALSLVAVAGIAAYQYHRNQQAHTAIAPATPVLSPGTTSVLHGLKAPVEIRFYALLDPQTTSESLRAFAGRVNGLLTEYEQSGNGKIRVVRFEEMNDANSQSAAADGIHSFNRDKGDACYLGITAVRDGQKESLTELSPDWETALESDLSRVMARLNETTAPGAIAANVAVDELAAARKAMDSNPRLASATPEQSTQILRDQALAEFKTAVAEMQSQTAAAEQRLAQGSASAAEIASEIQKIQAAQTARMQEITARLHNELAALAQMKTAAR